ncbi:iron uptake protein A1 [bacterium MnTg02]|nr:iron uptake protein A1 [bacterium MnTg02]
MTLYRSAGYASFGMAAFLFVVFCAAPAARTSAEEVVNVYSSRKPEFITPLLKVFEQLTDIKANVIYAKSDLVERIAAEGANSTADILLANEFSQLVAAKELQITQPVMKPLLAERINFAYRDPGGYWFGLSRRARIVLASKTRVKQNSFTYEELADPKWKGRVCIRSVRHPYNIILIASLLAHKGEAWTEKWLRGLKNNLAIKPAGGDRTQAANIHAGKCDVALVNTYYMGAMLMNDKKPEQKEWAASVKLIFPNAADRGSHVSISGMALAKHAPNAANGILLMDFLTSEPAQFIYALENHEYPIRDDVAPSKLVSSWGKLKSDFVPLERLAKLSDKARYLVDQIDFDVVRSAKRSQAK